MQRRHCHAVFFEDQRNRRTQRGPRHGDRIAFPRLNGNTAAEIEVQKRRPGPGGYDESVRTHFSHRGSNRHSSILMTNEILKLAILMEGDSVLGQPIPPGGHELVRTKMAVGQVMPTAGETGFQGRLQGSERLAVITSRSQCKIFSQ